MEEVARGPAEMGLGTVVEELDGRVARLEMRADAAAKTDQDISAWVKGVQDRVEKIEKHQAYVDLVEKTRIHAADEKVVLFDNDLRGLTAQTQGLAVAVNALLTRVTALESAVAAEIAPFPSVPIPPPRRRDKPRAKKKR